MCRSVPREFDSISAGARSLPVTSTLIGQPSSVVIIGIAYPLFRILLVSAWRLATPLKPSAPAAKLFSARPRGLKPWAKAGFGLRSQGDDADGDGNDGGGSTCGEPRRGVCQAQRCR